MDTPSSLKGPAEARLGRALSRSYLSPLRYPGGKRKLAARIGLSLDEHGIQGFDRILEPFAGGAAVSIAFLEAGIAKRAVLADLDPLVAAFWEVVFSSQANELADRVLEADVSLESWKRIRSSHPSNKLDLAFKCLFLNRTSFSGALSASAGPIGGAEQASNYKIDCRYNRYALAERIWELNKLSGRIVVHNSDFRRVIGSYRASCSRYQRQSGSFWYLDPPFFHKADRLYRYWFSRREHTALRRLLPKLPGKWFLSYDNCAEARATLRDLPGYALTDMRYTASTKNMVEHIKFKEVTAHNFAAGSLVPDATALALSSSEKQESSN